MSVYRVHGRAAASSHESSKGPRRDGIRVYCTEDEPPDETQRRCYDCAHMRGHVTWWCKNEAAIKWRGTAIPGVRNCPFWDPAPMRRPILRRLKVVWASWVSRAWKWLREVLGP